MFVPGAELSRQFYAEVVAPLVGDVPHAACLLGPGSDVLGFDTEMSMDHDWGPRCQILLPDDAVFDLSAELPREFRGFPVFVSDNEDGSTHMDAEKGRRHRVEVVEINTFFRNLLGCDVDQIDWLKVPQQKLLEATGPNVFHDDIGLVEIQQELAFFPHNVWLLILASLWQRIGQEEHLVGRAGYAGDEIGARILASRIVRDAMRIAFLLERRYVPYPKWFGTAFQRLSCARWLGPLCEAVLCADGWRARNERLGALYEALADLQNQARLCPPQTNKPTSFFGRPFDVIHLHAKFAEALVAEISDPELRKPPLIGSIDTISDNTDYHFRV